MPKRRKQFRLLLAEPLESRSLLAATRFGETADHDVLDRVRVERRADAIRNRQEQRAEMRASQSEPLSPTWEPLRPDTTEQRDHTPRRQAESPRPSNRQPDREQDGEPRRPLAPRGARVAPIVRSEIRAEVQQRITDRLSSRPMRTQPVEPPLDEGDLFLDPLLLTPAPIELADDKPMELLPITLPQINAPIVTDDPVTPTTSENVLVAFEPPTVPLIGEESTDNTPAIAGETDVPLPPPTADDRNPDRTLPLLRRRLNRQQRRLAEGDTEPAFEVPFDTSAFSNNAILGPAPPAISEQPPARFVGPLRPGELASGSSNGGFQPANVASEGFVTSIPAAIAAFVDDLLDGFDEANFEFAEPAAFDLALMNLPEFLRSAPSAEEWSALNSVNRGYEEATVIDETNGGLVELEPLGERPPDGSDETAPGAETPSDSAAAQSPVENHDAELGDLAFDDAQIRHPSHVAEPATSEGGLIELPPSEAVALNSLRTASAVTARWADDDTQDLSMDAYLGVFQMIEVASDGGELGPNFRVQDVFEEPVAAGLNLRPRVADDTSWRWFEAWVSTVIGSPRTLIPTIIVAASAAAIRSHLQSDSQITSEWHRKKQAASNKD